MGSYTSYCQVGEFLTNSDCRLSYSPKFADHHLNNRPFNYQTTFDNLNTRLVWHLDPHCTSKVGCDCNSDSTFIFSGEMIAVAADVLQSVETLAGIVQARDAEAAVETIAAAKIADQIAEIVHVRGIGPLIVFEGQRAPLTRPSFWQSRRKMPSSF